MLSATQTLYTNPNNTRYISPLKFFPKAKSISEIKRENLETRHSTYNYIESMYRTGKSFKYKIKNPNNRNHRTHLSSMENFVRGIARNSSNDINDIYILKNECDVMRRRLKDDYYQLKREMNNEIDNCQVKFELQYKKSNIQSKKTNQEMKNLKKEIIDCQNFVIELKDRINSLKLRIDGNKMYNEDNLPVLQTKIEY